MIKVAAALSNAAVLVAAASSLAAAQEHVSVRPEPGLWKVLTKSSQNGTPLQDKTENRCYSAAEFEDLVATFATPFPDKDCSARDHAVAGNTLTLTATCTGEAPQGGMLSVRQDGSYVFEDAKRFTGSLTTTFALPNQPSIVFSLTKVAEHVGPCPN
jgi:hypothetical protein